MKITTLKNPSRKPYIYKVTNLETHQYYIGSQCSGKKIGHNYFTSSTNKNFRDGFKNYREEKYKIEIIKEFEDPDECVHAENYMIRDHMQLKDGLCLNRACCCGGKKIFSRVGIPHTDETRKKMSKAHNGHPAWNKGVPRSEETRKKMSRTLKGRPATYKGHHHTEETRKRISEAQKIKISIEGEVFNSIAEAAKYYNVAIGTIRYWLKTKKHNTVYIK